MIGSVGPVLFDAPTEFGVHQHRRVRTRCWGQRGEQQIERCVQIGEQLAVPSKRVAVLAADSLFAVIVESTMTGGDHAGTDACVQETGGHDHLPTDVRRAAWDVLHRRADDCAGRQRAAKNGTKTVGIGTQTRCSGESPERVLCQQFHRVVCRGSREIAVPRPQANGQDIGTHWRPVIAAKRNGAERAGINRVKPPSQPAGLNGQDARACRAPAALPMVLRVEVRQVRNVVTNTRDQRDLSLQILGLRRCQRGVQTKWDVGAK